MRYFKIAKSKDNGPVDTGTSSANPLSQSPVFAFTNLLWIGAHPNDEIPSSPLLIDFCSRPGKTCTLLSLTKGESGQCKLAGGCVPDLVSVRSIEFAEAGQYMVADVVDFIDQVDPDVILTFDPRHGTTCHPDHRATGQLAILAAQEAGIAMDSIFLVETVIKGVAGSTTIGFRSLCP